MKPFLTLPFKLELYKIGGGWFYRPQDLITKVGGSNRHFAIDLYLSQGTPVLAAASGWAISSYHHFLLRKKSDRRRFIRYRGKLFGSGQGNFVVIYHPRQRLFTQYGHLERVNPTIPFYKPKKKRGLVQPPVERFQPRLFNQKNARRVKGGEVIGWVGGSGIIGGWDKPHLHFELYRYRDREGKKPGDSFLDPYDIYKTANHYPWPGHKRPMGDNHLWVLGKRGLPSH